MPSDSDKGFQLRSGSAAFNDRLKNVFSFSEVKIKAPTSSEKRENASTNENNRNAEELKSSSTREFKGRESLFRVPKNEWDKPRGSRRFDDDDDDVKHRRARGHKNRDRNMARTPDFKLNPHKYTKYSLEGVQNVTDKSNQRAAFAFLDELRKRKNGDEQNVDENEKNNEKIMFKRPVKKSKNVSSETDEKESSSSKSVFLMPECVVGASSAGNKKKDFTKIKTSEKSKNKKGNAMILSHLMADDEDENDN